MVTFFKDMTTQSIDSTHTCFCITKSFFRENDLTQVSFFQK